MKNVTLLEDGRVRYEKDGVAYITMQTLREIAGKSIVIKAKRVKSSQMGENDIAIIQ